MGSSKQIIPTTVLDESCLFWGSFLDFKTRWHFKMRYSWLWKRVLAECCKKYEPKWV